MNKKRQRAAGMRGAAPNTRNDISTFHMARGPMQAAAAADQRIPDLTHWDDKPVKVGQKLSNGQIEIDFSTGDFFYRAFMLKVEAANNTTIGSLTAAQSVTRAEDNRWYVRSERFDNLFERIRLTVDGIDLWDFESWVEFEQFLAMNYWQFRPEDPVVYIGFGGPYTFADHLPLRELFGLGTANLRDVKLTLYTTPQYEDGMKLLCYAGYSPVRENSRRVITREVYKTTFATSGKHIFRDLPIDRRISRLVVTTNSGKRIASYKFKFGDIQIVDMPYSFQKISAQLRQRGEGPTSAPAPYRTGSGSSFAFVGAVIDLNFDELRNGTTLPKLDSDENRRRNDQLQLEMELLDAETEVKIEVYCADVI